MLFNSSWLYQVFVFSIAFGIWAGITYPVLYVYQSNNKHRTFAAAIAKERAHKKKLRELEKQAEEAEAAAAAAAGGAESAEASE